MKNEEIYKTYFDKILPLCRKYFDENRAFDVCQDAFIDKVLPGIDKFKGEGNLEGYIRKIVNNYCIDQTRKEKNHHIVSFDDLKRGTQYKITKSDSSGEDIFQTEVGRNKLKEFINKLSPVYRQVIELHLQGLKHDEIAKKLGVSLSAIKTNFMKAKANLKRMLEDSKIVAESFNIDALFEGIGKYIIIVDVYQTLNNSHQPW